MPETRGSVRQRKKQQAAQGTDEPPAAAAGTVPEPDEAAASSAPEEEEEEEKTDGPPRTKRSAKGRVDDEDADGYSPWLDVLRVLSFLLLASAGLSYVISGGESYTWGLRHPPKYLQTKWWKAQFVRRRRPPLPFFFFFFPFSSFQTDPLTLSPLQAPLQHLTPAELARYDGSDPELPIYLAINGTVFDVSANRRTYGPGGSYNVFAGADASRGFVTGCFAEDRTADMRGVEKMFLPRDDPDVDRHIPADALARLRIDELREARKKVHDALAHWAQFFENSPKYPKVGYVDREPGWLDKEPRRPLCAEAEKGRPKRQIPERHLL